MSTRASGGGRKPSIANAIASKNVYVPPGHRNAITVDAPTGPGVDVTRVIRDSEGNIIVPPELLTQEGMQIWAVILPDLIDSGVFRASDVIMLVELCEVLASAQIYRRRVAELTERLNNADSFEEENMVDGMLKRARSSQIAALQMAIKIAGEFGISPVARVRLGLMRVKGATLLSSFGDGDDDD